MIVPLADALGVSVLDIMTSESMRQEQIPTEQVSHVLSDIIDIATYERKIARRNTAIACIGILAVVSTIFLIDNSGVFGFMMVYLPIILLASGIILVASSLWRMRRKKPYMLTLIIGILLLLYPFLLFFMMVFAFALGGPVPN